MAQTFSCRSCGSTSLEKVIDLGLQPLANNLLRPENLGQPEPRFPLDVWVCSQCWLMQISHIVPPVTLFSEYVYFSSFSDQMLRHAREASLRYIEEKKLGADSFVIEVASNDGYLLKNFVQAGVPCLGFEPAANIAEVARKNGVDTHCEFFGTESASGVKATRGGADLILGNNVFAHAPDTNDFVKGLATLLKPDGWIVLEFPYGADMIDKVEFDTIYHEHVFYFTLLPLIPLFERHGLEIFHVERIAIHGGSLRVFAAHRGVETVRDSVVARVADEVYHGVNNPAYYQRFSERAEKVRADLIAFLEEQKTAGKRVAAYGASAKGSTLVNYVGEAAGSLEFMADRSTYKHGLLSPGLHIPILPAESLAEKQPDYAVLLAWNFAEEIMKQQSAYAEKGGRFVIPLPELRIV
ncbi:MAG TPA: class I SAM-dependent methyltransferase [Candidatus Saccharimonadia bacterium]|nr:class I SAM-dependent methyltransferase [Candidatus Saccharimonadia bacterium]